MCYVGGMTVRQILNSLGSTVVEVAESLRGVRGEKSNPKNCPLANLLNRHYQNVSVFYNSGSETVVIYYNSDPKQYNTADKRLEFESSGLWNFLYEFDHGEWSAS